MRPAIVHSYHIQQLPYYFHEYFGDDDTSMFDWNHFIRNPFECQLTDLTGREQEELAELLSDRTLHLQFNRMSLLSFWITCAQEYPLLSNKPSMFSSYHLVRNSIFCSHCDENQIQIKTEH